MTRSPTFAPPARPPNPNRARNEARRARSPIAPSPQGDDPGPGDAGARAERGHGHPLTSTRRRSAVSQQAETAPHEATTGRLRRSVGSDYPFVCRQDHFHKSRKSQPGITSPDAEAALPPDAERLQLCAQPDIRGFVIIGARSTKCLVSIRRPLRARSWLHRKSGYLRVRPDFVSANRALLKLITLDAVPNIDELRLRETARCR
jgi:hypothetical protein